MLCAVDWQDNFGVQVTPCAGAPTAAVGQVVLDGIHLQVSIELTARLGHWLWGWDDKSPHQLGAFHPSFCSNISTQCNQAPDLALLPLRRTYGGLLSAAIICSFVPKHTNIQLLPTARC